jgi:imidazolonepropionase-like amidohydrolase
MPTKPIAIRTSRLFDGVQFLPGAATVLIEGGLILGVEEGFPAVGDRFQIMDRPNSTVLPGLIDTHVHLVADSGRGALDRIVGFTADELDTVVTDGLRRQLANGVTTVRDLGDRRFCVVDRRDRQRAGLNTEPEPTIIASGPPLTSPGGHCAAMGGEVRGIAAIVNALQERIDRRVDVVKIMASGGMNTVGTDVLRPQFSFQELQAAVDLAHSAGLPVSIHAHALTAVEQAVEVFAEGIEHCSCLTEKGPHFSEDLLARLAASGAAIGAALGMPPPSEFEHSPPNVRLLMAQTGVTPEQIVEQRMESMGRMYRAGVTLVTGSDAGIAPWLAHGLLRGSINTLAEISGSVAVALAASTSVAAGVCAVGDRKGLLRAGYDADICIVQGDLQADVQALERVRTVVLGGTVLG